MLVWPMSTIFSILTGSTPPATGTGARSAALTVVFWATLFTLAVHETAADRRYAERLRLPG